MREAPSTHASFVAAWRMSTTTFCDVPADEPVSPSDAVQLTAAEVKSQLGTAFDGAVGTGPAVAPPPLGSHLNSFLARLCSLSIR